MSAGETKECPFCAEPIRAAAVFCRFCGRDLPLPEVKTAPVLIGTPAVNAQTSVSRAGIPQSEIFDLLSVLVDKSLVVYEEDEQGHGRYRLLETVRQYARDRLLESHEGADVRDRHVQLFLQLAEEAQSQIVGPEEVEWLERLETEHDNLRAALEWSAASGDPEIGLRMASALSMFWFLHVHRREGIGWLEQLLTLPPGAPAVARAKALDAVGLLAFFSDPGRARQRLEESLLLSRELEYDVGVASALEKLACLSESYEEGLALAEESVRVARATGDRPVLLGALAWLAARIDRRSHPERLHAVAHELMEISEGLESGLGMAMAYRAMAWIASDEGDLASARQFMGEELARVVPLKDWAGVYGALYRLAELAGRQGDYQWAGRMLGLQERLDETTGLGDPVLRAADRVRLAAESGAPSAEAFAGARAEGRAMTLQQAIDYALAPEEGDS